MTAPLGWPYAMKAHRDNCADAISKSNTTLQYLIENWAKLSEHERLVRISAAMNNQQHALLHMVLAGAPVVLDSSLQERVEDRLGGQS